MPSPVPKHLRSEIEVNSIPLEFRHHISNIVVDPQRGVAAPNIRRHPAKYAPGLASELVRIAQTPSIGDPMCGTGTIARETGLACALNDIDPTMAEFLNPLVDQWGCELSFGPASSVAWSREVCIFSPPYYPRTDRRVRNAKNEAVRGAPVGFSDAYDCQDDDFIGNPSGANGIAIYREGMRQVYQHLASVCGRMVVVTKNWTRLGTELRLDLDTILMCREAGWKIVARHGFTPKPSLWSRYNQSRGGGVEIEDIMVFEPD